MNKEPLHWPNASAIGSRSYTCGYCGSQIASEKGFHGGGLYKNRGGPVRIHICHKCTRPTFFDYDDQQSPSAKTGLPVQFIPDPNVEVLFEESKTCFSINAYTSAVMCCRKLLMNIAVSHGAKEGLSYVQYVDHLNETGFIPPNGKAWVDKIRRVGNTANHKIILQTADEARMIIRFTEMLLRFVYELPGMLERDASEANG